MGVDLRTLGSCPELKADAERAEPLRHPDSFFFPVLRTLLCVETAAVSMLMGEVARSGTPLRPSLVFHSVSRHSGSSTHTEAWLKGLPCGRLWLPKEGRKEIVRQEWACGKERMAPALPTRRWLRAWRPEGACPQGRTARGVSLPHLCPAHVYPRGQLAAQVPCSAAWHPIAVTARRPRTLPWCHCLSRTSCLTMT